MGIANGKVKILKREDRSYHVFTHPLSLFFTLSPDFAVHIESCVLPTQYLFDKVRVCQMFAQEKGEDFMGEKRQSREVQKAEEDHKREAKSGKKYLDKFMHNA